MHLARAPRTTAAAICATVLLPLGLGGCASHAEVVGQVAELRAAQDSNLLAMPTEQLYTLSSFQITAPNSLVQLSQAAQAEFSYSGLLVLSDGIITEAEFAFSTADFRGASFVLTEPTTLQRGEHDTGPTHAVGELTIGTQLPAPAVVKFTPTAADEQTLAFDVDLDVPNELTFPQGSPHVDKVQAHIELTAAP